MDAERSDLREDIQELMDRVSRLEWERDDPVRQKVSASIESRITSLEEDRKRVWLAGWAVVFFLLASTFEKLRTFL